MPEAGAILRFQKRLVELGCPAFQLRRKVRELAEHHEDLQQAAREEGLSEAEAADRATRLLGEPLALAEQITAVLRQSSWCGRHPFIAFCLLPPLLLPVASFLAIYLSFQLLEIYFTAGPWSVTANGGAGFQFLVGAARDASYFAITSVTLMFCWFARRSASGMKCALWSCLLCSLHGYFSQVSVLPHRFVYGYNFPLFWTPGDWILPTIPLLIALLVFARQWLSVHRLPIASADFSPEFEPEPAPRPFFLRSHYFTPTSLTAAILAIAAVSLALSARTVFTRQRAHAAELKARVWPAERTAVIQTLRARQIPATALSAITISLNSRLNCSLAEAIDGPPEAAANNLASLPRGIHVFAGVPFDVRGRIQLAGRALLETRTQFPAKVKGIAISRKVQRLHLLHAATSLKDELLGKPIAGLVLHFADGSQERIPIIAGDHVLDWWGPIYQTGAASQRKPSSSTSELAWVGINPWIAREQPDFSLRLYRSTFDNPHPDREVATVDLVSTLTDAAPFLVGITVV
jgi:hypothetical protein